MPSLVKELAGTIRKIAPRERWDLVDDLPERLLRASRLVEALSLGRLPNHRAGEWRRSPVLGDGPSHFGRFAADRFDGRVRFVM